MAREIKIEIKRGKILFSSFFIKENDFGTDVSRWNAVRKPPAYTNTKSQFSNDWKAFRYEG
jgi:hypothetical protein